jgi:hypothetical protein
MPAIAIRDTRHSDDDDTVRTQEVDRGQRSGDTASAQGGKR